MMYYAKRIDTWIDRQTNERVSSFEYRGYTYLVHYHNAWTCACDETPRCQHLYEQQRIDTIIEQRSKHREQYEDPMKALDMLDEP